MKQGRRIEPKPRHASDVGPAAPPFRPASPLASWWWLTIPALAFTLVILYRMRSGPGYPLDDAWIHLAFARHMAHGQGFGINPSQWSTGSTSPLWALMLAVGLLPGGGHSVWPWLLGAIALAGSGMAAALVIHRLLARRRELGAPSLRPAAILGGLLVVSTPGLLWSAAGAMEAPLFTALMLLAWAERLREDLPAGGGGRALALWGIPAGLAMLARPEGALFIVLLALFSRRRSGIVNLIVSAGIYAPYGIYCLSVSGRFWPSTFYAKTTRAIAGLPDLGYVLRSVGSIAQLMPALVALLMLGVLALGIGAIVGRPPGGGDPARMRLRERVTRWSPYLPGVLFIPALLLAYASMGRTFLFAGLAGNFGRYFFPLAPFLVILGVMALVVGAGGLPRRRIRSGWLLLVLGAFVGWNSGAAFGKAALFAHNVRDINAMQVEMAHRLARQLPPDALVAANDVGALAYFTDLRVLDLVGIVSPEVQQVLFPLRHADRVTRQRALFQLLIALKPQAIVVFPQWYREILQSLQPVLELMEEVRVPDNITAAQVDLVAYRLRWSKGALPPGPSSDPAPSPPGSGGTR